uniref:Secreted protein n=1 Tax=Tanacetum cinerariifolium TaxID=118510 RepID=A0A699JT88_TANCI|nr:hypothetical protein [Tanacetum cinerariifolium]
MLVILHISSLAAVIFLIHQSPCATSASRMLLFPNLVLLQYLVLILNHLNPRTEPCTAATVPTMMCHPPIRPAATCTVPRIQLLAASRRHVAASCWTAASDVAPMSAPVTTVNAAGQRRSTLLDHWSTVVDHRSTAADHGGDRWSTVAVNDSRRWWTTIDCRWTTVDHHQTTGQRWLVNSQRWTWAESGSGLGRVWIGSGPGPPRGIDVDADVDNMPYVGVEPGALLLKT